MVVPYVHMYGGVHNRNKQGHHYHHTYHTIVVHVKYLRAIKAKAVHRLTLEMTKPG